MKPASVVVDTNVAKTADGKATHANATCLSECLRALKEIRNRKKVVLDSAGHILREYLAHKPRGFPQGVGDLFFIWVIDNQANPRHCRRVCITELSNDPRGFAEFPDDQELRTFHSKDRKFVAAAVASGDNPEILNATDKGWWEHRKPLARNGIHVKFLCPDLMAEDRHA